jgi:anti-sigma factor RsiW
MNHPTEDQLLLLAYGELAEPHASAVESHIAACTVCAQQLSELERSRVALDLALPRRRRPAIALATLALAAAAGLAAIVISKAGPSRDPTGHWTPTTTWSATAGYVAGGKAMVEIDAQLTRLEQERYYGLPN